LACVDKHASVFLLEELDELVGAGDEVGQVELGGVLVLLFDY
jgi:hypothetical protein